MQRVIRSFSIAVLLGFFTVASAGVPPLPQVNGYLNLAEDLYKKGDYKSAFRVMQKLIALQKEHSLISDEFHFKYARVALSVDSIKVALDSVNKYLLATGEEGQFYKEALALLREVEKAEIRAEETGNEMPANSGDGFENEVIRTGGTCDGLPVGSSCWMALINHLKCYVWNDDLREGEIMTWSGRCSDGFAQGRGTLITTALYEGNVYTNKGEEKGYFQNGKRHGHWIELPFDEIIKQGPYVNGKRHGQWVYRYYKYYYTLEEEKGPYVNGRRHGHWVIHDSHPDMVLEGPYVNGKKHGHWVQHYSDGSVGGGSYVDGKRHGHWVTRNSISFEQNAFYNSVGKPYQRWGYRYPDGSVGEGLYVDGKRHGHWVYRYPDGSVKEGSYVDFRRQGQWVYRYPDGYKSKGKYVDGEREGVWLDYDYSEKKCWSYTYHQGELVEKKKINKEMCR